ncbi:MAG TPA: serine hydrolase domain-containing protein [Flavobacterium sp.]|uniref:serine hydrolase domain-containing protein n=1 Tax=unclassified Flavobacterium TaxID=196869 RepID=UPI0025B8B11B|nr:MULTISPECIES: serine hydrolase domain-containing protein [unclassified Flavobacterium]HRE76816.1 serine hydrolase domain-containing protein [Flavobacterium sp.]
MKHFIYLIILSIIFTNKTYTQSIKKKIDKIILNEFNDSKGPGGVFMVTKNGKPIYEKAFGKANLELGVDLTTNNVFQLASMTKQFTAISILMLEEQGKLNTLDSISKYIPDYPNGNKITIHHLLTHTSGIKDFTKMKSLKDIAQKEMSPKMMVDFFKDEPVDFEPGEKFEYSNSGYILLGYLIELTSGTSFDEFIKESIFKKIGMNQSDYASDRKIIKNRAYGYQKKESGYVNKTIINFSVPYASGALMSSLSDMLKWQNALNEDVLLKAKNLKKAFKKNKLNSGEEITYGYGWHIRTINGSESREHGGSIFGFKTMAVYIPSEDIYVIGLTNCDCFSPTKITQDIAKLVFEKYEKK